MSVFVDFSYRYESHLAPEIFKVPGLVALRKRVAAELQHPAGIDWLDDDVVQTDRWRNYGAMIGNIALLESYSKNPNPLKMWQQVIERERFMRGCELNPKARVAVHQRHMRKPVIDYDVLTIMARDRGLTLAEAKTNPHIVVPENSVIPALIVEEAVVTEVAVEHAVILRQKAA